MDVPHSHKINISPGFRRYFANTSWLMGHRVLSMVVALFVSVYVARYLGPERFGLLSYAGSFVGLFTALATLGLDGIMVRELVKAPERRDELLGTAFWLKAGGAIMMWIGIAAAIPFTHNDTQTNILIIIIAFGAIFQAFNVIDFNYQAEVKSKFVVYAHLVQLVVSSITKLIFVWISAPLVWFACVFLLDGVVLAVGLTAMYLKNTGRIWYWKWRLETAKELLRDSWPLILSGMVISIYMKIDQVMIKEMLDASEVGIYAAGVRISQALYVIPMVIAVSLYPKLVELHKSDSKEMVILIQSCCDFLVFVAIIIAIIITISAKQLILLLFGSAYSRTALVLVLHIWSFVFICAEVMVGRWAITEGIIKLIAVRNFFSAISNIILNLYLIPKYGAAGAAIASLGAIFLSYYLFFSMIKITRQMFFIQSRSILSLGTYSLLKGKFFLFR